MEALPDQLRDFVASADIDELKRLALVHDLEFDCDDHDEISALLLSFFSSTDRRTVIINELRSAFPTLRDEADLIASLLESTDLCISHALLTQLAEISGSTTPVTLLQLDHAVQPADVEARAEGVLAIESSSSRDVLPPAVCFEDARSCRIAFAALPVSRFGVVRVRVLGQHLQAARVFVVSPQFNYVTAAGLLLDELCWGAGSAFSAELEAALLQMVIAVGEDLEAAVQRMRPLMSLVAGAAQESDHMLFQMKKDVASALENDHRSLAIGRLHQFLDQLQNNGGDMSVLMSLPQSFKDAAAAFFSAKAACLPPVRFRQRLHAALEAAKQLQAYISSSPHPPATQAFASLTSFIIEASNIAFDAQVPVTAAETDIAALLKPKLLGARLPSLLFMPVLSMDDVQNVSALNQTVELMCERLEGDVAMIGSLLGHKIASSNLPLSASLITRLIDCGMAYVSSPSDTLIATLNLRRSVLALNSSVPPPHSAKRMRELSRVLRAAKKQSSAALSLRLNTDIDLAIAKLRAHHKDDCWVGPELAEVWRMMTKTSPPQLMVFELWLGEEMIAADFTHPIWTSFGRSVYVATRFFDRKAHNKLQPGFLLCFAECYVLQSAGCVSWDLGGYDLCPIMQYKLDLAGEPKARNVALAQFRDAQSLGDAEGMRSLRSGTVLIGEITQDTLAWSKSSSGGSAVASGVGGRGCS